MRESIICLVGMPGSGKSTVGRALAKRLGWKYFDSDMLIEKEVGSSVRTFFENQGEQRFRDIETSIIDRLTILRNIVLATGGGSVLRKENRVALRRKCHVVYLRSSPEELYRRLRYDAIRPLLQVPDPLARLRDLYQERDPLYQEVAHFILDTGRPSVSALVNMVLMQLELAGVIHPSLVPSPVEPQEPN